MVILKANLQQIFEFLTITIGGTVVYTEIHQQLWVTINERSHFGHRSYSGSHTIKRENEITKFGISINMITHLILGVAI